ncbi:MAG: lipocalin-like domain-containing protein [Tannerella sp.]|jgi:hypothetical protein|nr:lipocalin-like domain-containing protein [Tannerella sp.]
MKKLLFLFPIILVFINACSDGDMPDINGMWQLKTIEDANHNVWSIDTVFYAFQRQSVFSYTILHEEEDNSAAALQIYGFIDFPDNDHLHIQLDKAYYEHIYYVFWKNTEITYDIVQLDSKRLVLSQNGEIYHFKKF